MKIENAVHNMFAIKAKGYQYKAWCDKANSNPAKTSPAKIFPYIRIAKEAKLVNSSKMFIGVIKPGVTNALKYSLTPLRRTPST